MKKLMLFTISLTMFLTSCKENKQSISSGETDKVQIIAINGSPRDKENTATMCKFFLDGAKSANKNVETTLINLYELNFKGCTSCFGCKLADSKSYGKCAMEDELTPVLEKIAKADGIAFASPIYFGEVTGEMRSFLERCLFQYVTYEASRRTLAPKRIPTATIYTMNVTEEGSDKSGYNEYFDKLEGLIARVFQQPKRLCAYNTYQFEDYSKYKADLFSEPDKREHKEKQFPIDCQSAFDAGKQMVNSVLKDE